MVSAGNSANGSAGRPTSLCRTVCRTTLESVTSLRGPSGPASRLPRALAVLARLSLIALVGFHAWRFVVRAFEGQLFAPDVVLRWGAGLGLFAALVALRRVGVPVWHGRKAAVLWTLVFLLHWHAAVSRPLAPGGHPIIPEVAEAVAVFSAGAVLLAGAALLNAAAASRPDRREHVVGWVAVRPVATSPASWHRLCLAPRPPPA